MSEKYTAEELDGMNAMMLRRIGSNVLALPLRDCVNMSIDALKKAIIEKQEGGNGAAAAPATATVKRTKTEKAEEPKAPVKGDKVDFVGKAIDDLDEKLTAKLEEMENQMAKMDKELCVIFGLVSDIWKSAAGDPSELDARVTELTEKAEEEGNS
jgi:hypothetical protein